MNDKIEIPTNCPTCSSELVTVNMQLFCVNKECPAMLDKNLLHFISTIGIKGIGAKTLPKLNFRSITDIYAATEEDLISATSEKVGSKVYNQIQESSKAELHKVIAAFGIPLVGKSAGEKLVKVISSIDDVTYEVCRNAGLGDKVSLNLVNFLSTEFEEIREKLPFSFTTDIKEHEQEKGYVCITGKLVSFKNKLEAKEALSNAGYNVVDSVTKTTNYLVDETEDNSTKRIKADKLNIPIITNLSDFIKEENK